MSKRPWFTTLVLYIARCLLIYKNLVVMLNHSVCIETCVHNHVCIKHVINYVMLHKTSLSSSRWGGVNLELDRYTFDRFGFLTTILFFCSERAVIFIQRWENKIFENYSPENQAKTIKMLVNVLTNQISMISCHRDVIGQYLPFAIVSQHLAASR